MYNPIYGSKSIPAHDAIEYARDGMICMISAFRSYFDHETNMLRTEELLKNITSLGYDYAKVYGSYREASNGYVSREVSFVIINPESPTQDNLNEFRKIMSGIAADYQQDSFMIAYGKSDSPRYHSTIAYVDKYGSSEPSKSFFYERISDNEVDYSDYLYKTKIIRKNTKKNKISGSYPITAELWGRDTKHSENFSVEESINEIVYAGDYTRMDRFSHIQPKQLFSYYTESISGDDVYSIYSSQHIIPVASILRINASTYSGRPSKRVIYNNRMKFLQRHE
jgi:hypothetical protein